MNIIKYGHFIPADATKKFSYDTEAEKYQETNRNCIEMDINKCGNLIPTKSTKKYALNNEKNQSIEINRICEEIVNVQFKLLKYIF